MPSHWESGFVYEECTLPMAAQLLSRVRPFAIPWTVAYSLLCPWDFPGKSTGVGCHFLLQRIFPTQGSNLALPHCRQTLYPLSHGGSPMKNVPCQCCSVAQLCPTLCDPMECSTPGFPVHHQLLELAQTHIHRVDRPSNPHRWASTLSKITLSSEMG